MAQLREIKSRIKAVANIERITRTMQMIATAKFQSAVRRVHETKPYTEKLAELVGELAEAGGEELDHPLLTGPEEPTGRQLMLVLSSNRGLCGAYNAHVLRRASQLMDNYDGQTELEVAGKKGRGYFRFAGREVHHTYTEFGDKPTYEDVEQIGRDYIERFESGRYDAVHVVYTRFYSNSKQEPEALQLLPVERPAGEQKAGGDGHLPVYEFSPDPQQLLAELLPLTVKSRLFQCFNDAVVSEHLARMVAMKAATDNANEMNKNLKRKFNRARQAQITTELTEIVGGAAALS